MSCSSCAMYFSVAHKASVVQAEGTYYQTEVLAAHKAFPQSE